ncbi:MAG: hypothetical protein JWO36_1278 [Myxococcales bacterium]|nr:hypothetical protein [Myxococcales bacterium]
MRAILDAGAFVAIDKRDRRVGALLRVLQQRRIPLWTSASVVAQVWRNGARQVEVARLLPGVGVRPLGTDEAKRAGELQGVTRTADVVDAHLTLLVAAGDRVLTSDPIDLGRLLAARGVAADLVEV